MSRSITFKEPEALPAGMYLAKVAAIDEEESKFGGTCFKWVFELIEEDKTISGYTSGSDSTNGKLAKWSGAILGRTLGQDEDLDLDDLIGRRVNLLLEGEEKDGAGFNKILSLAPFKKAAKSSTAQPAQTVEEDEDNEPDYEGN